MTLRQELDTAKGAIDRAIALVPPDEPPPPPPPPPPDPEPEPEFPVDIEVGAGYPEVNAIDTIQAAITSGAWSPTDPIVLGVGTHVLDPLKLLGKLSGLNACLDVGGTSGLTIQGEDEHGTILKLLPADYYGLAGPGLDLHMIGGRESKTITGFKLRGLTIDGGYMDPVMRRTEQMHGFHPYSSQVDTVFERVHFRRICGDSAKFMRASNVKALRCTHTDNGRSAWAFHNRVVGFLSEDEEFIRISDQWIDCEPGSESDDFRVIRPKAVDGFITTGNVKNFYIEDMITGSIMIGGLMSTIHLVRPVLTSRQVGMNNSTAIRQMQAIWSIKEVAHLIVEEPRITADAAHVNEVISMGYRVHTEYQLNEDGTQYIDPVTGKPVVVAKRLKNVKKATILGGSIIGGGKSAAGVGCSDAYDVTVDGTQIEGVVKGVGFAFRGASLDPSFQNTAGPWTVRAAKIKASQYGIAASLADKAGSAVLRLGQTNEVDAPTPLYINNLQKVTVEEVA